MGRCNEELTGITRYRRGLRDKVILQVQTRYTETDVNRYNYGGSVISWRDARFEDITVSAEKEG